MINKSIIDFENGSLLTKEMLECMYDYPINVLNCLYSNYSNGIISGFDVIEKEKSIYITKGLLKLDNSIYIMKEDFNINTLLNNLEESTTYNIVFVEENNITNKNGVKNLNLKIVINEGIDDNKIKFRFGKFKWNGKSSLELPTTIDSLFKNTILNLNEIEYAQNNTSTYHPLIFRCIFNYLKDKKDKNMLDYIIINEISKNNVLNIEIIKSYIEEKGFSIKSFNKEELLKKFIETIKLEKKENIHFKEEKSTITDDDDDNDGFMI